MIVSNEMILKADVERLKIALRDILALSAIPAAWVGREPSAIASGLADMLVNSLGLDFAFVRLCDPNGDAAVETTRGSAWPEFQEWLLRHLAKGCSLWRWEVISDIGDDAQRGRGIVIPLGANAEGGLIAVSSNRACFPDEADQLLLSVAAGHTSTACRMARFIDDHCRVEAALRESERQLREARDELERKVAERTAELQRSQAYLAEAQRLTRTGSWAWDPRQEEMLHCSEEIFRIYGLDPRDGLPFHEILSQRIHPLDRDRVRESTLEGARKKEERFLEYRILLPDGTLKYVESVRRPVLDATGEVVEIVGTSIDVTERKRDERERERLRKMEADLAHVNRISMLGELTASLAHEIKQPIAGVITSANACMRWLAADPPDLERARAAVTRIERDGARAVEIFDRLRSFYKKGGLEQQAPVDVNGVIREMAALLHEECAQAWVTLRLELADTLPKALADRVQVQQILMNLMLNAIEAMKDSGGILKVKSELQTDGQLLISVCDTGVGFPPEAAEQIFSSFYTTKPKGTGMGLAITRSLVEAHGGQVWAIANPGSGATFYVTLPIQDGAALN